MAYSIARPISIRRPGESPIVQSLLAWLVLLGFVGLTNLFVIYVGAGLENDPRRELLSWPAIALFGIVGSIGILLAHRTGFPRAWGDGVPVSRRLGVPALLGVAIGLFESALDMVTHWSTSLSYGASGAFHVQGPGAPLFYSSGAIEVEVIYRLLTVPLLLWVTSNLLLRGRFQTQIFWVLAVLSSLLEPMDQDFRELGNGASVTAVAAAFIPDLLLNLAQVVMFRRYGFVASIATRVVFYLVWHVAYGNFVCGC